MTNPYKELHDTFSTFAAQAEARGNDQEREFYEDAADNVRHAIEKSRPTFTRVLHIESREEYNHDLMIIPDGMTVEYAIAYAKETLLKEFRDAGRDLEVEDEDVMHGGALLFHTGDPTQWEVSVSVHKAPAIPFPYL